jgi:hypothetical protein
MAECRIVDKLAKFVPVRNDVLLMSVLRLLHNLSFDTVMRDGMVKNGLIPKVSRQLWQACMGQVQSNIAWSPHAVLWAAKEMCSSLCCMSLGDR